ncbi:MAG: antitoxin MazE family protein [Anaerolineaceae bacterium]|nr:antitoxin MazE family protein [Anaerolineaceae bacterium]
MPRPAAHDGLSKFQRYRETRKKAGMKLLRIWVPDPHAPGFAEEVARQAKLLKGAPEELEALDFIEAAAADWDTDEA